MGRMVNEFPHFHSTDDVIYVSYLDPADGQLRLRVYLVLRGGVLEEFIYPKPKESERTMTQQPQQPQQPQPQEPQPQDPNADQESQQQSDTRRR